MWGWTEEQSAALHIQALVSADGILPVISFKLQLLIINLASVPGRQLVNSPTAAILERYASCIQTLYSYRLQQINGYEKTNFYKKHFLRCFWY